MPTLSDIEAASRKYSEAREQLSAIVSAMTDAIDAIKRNNIKRLKKAVESAAEYENRLRNLIEEAPDLFVKPRTVVFHGIKVGLQKGKGKIEWSDPEQVVRLIEKHFPEHADLLISTQKRPAKDALTQLSAAELKRLGVTIIEAGDQVFIKPTDSEVDKMVDVLLKDATSDAEVQ